MFVVELAFQFGRLFATEVRKANDGADKQKEHGELGVRLSASQASLP
jgi:hypothetical protein